MSPDACVLIFLSIVHSNRDLLQARCFPSSPRSPLHDYSSTAAVFHRCDAYFVGMVGGLCRLRRVVTLCCESARRGNSHSGLP